MQLSSRLNEYVIALNLPIFPENRAERFKKFFCSILNKSDPAITAENIQIPLKEGNSQGFAFIKCKDASSARNLILTADYSPIDKNTSARLISPDQFSNYLKGDKKPQQLEVAPLPKKPQNFSWYLVDERLFDQIVYSVNKLPRAAWFNHTNASVEDITLPNYIQSTDDFFFSPDGSFFVTRTGNRISTYCGEDWMQFSVIEYPNLKDYYYSPSGRYMILQGDTGCERDNPHKPIGATVYDMLTNTSLLRLCVDRDYSKNIDFGAGDIVLFQGKTEMRAFYPPDYKKSESIKQVFDHFDPSRTDKVLFTFREAVKSTPPRIAFYSTENFDLLYSISSYNAVDAYCVWHPNLAVCAVVVTTSAKNHKKTSMTVYDLQNPKNVLTYNVQDIKGMIVTCAWDPAKDYLKVSAIVEAAGSKQIRLFHITKNINQIAAYTTSGTNLQYSPSGRFAVADDINNGSVIVQFYDMECGLIKALDMDGIESIEWDPSGVFVMTASSRPSGGTAGYSIWLLDGNKVINKKLQGFKKCLWRPRIMILDQKDYDAVSDKVDEAVKKYGRFGAVDAKLLEEEKKQQKVKQMQKWRQFTNAGAYSHVQSKKADEFEFRIKVNLEDDS
ncbi:hypothetical protein TRFO_22328 [Tritrichomonas foetus]|uniref:Translation initiation factor beta propellor-like domain-containing protein n=1 Tax=Tritrichomonas foetus TaxID=1144522 RepID=A0A1J4KC42_9EUKA|nr:hypothetical protein TRFO_22328 [Tritrichomonas foetus]|eukprot:OHT08983.1 hypothetical protein TRFO_22328 [Tritrichomonas foetus]